MNFLLQQMLRRHRLMNAETGGEGSGGGNVEPTNVETKTEEVTPPEPKESKTLTDAEAKLLKEVMDKKNRLKEAEEEKNRLSTELKRFEGIDPDEVRAILNERKQAQLAEMEKRGEFDRLRAQMAEEHKKEVGTLAERLTSAEQRARQLESTIAELTVGNSFAASQFIRDELALTPSKARVVYGGHFEFKDGALIAYDKPAGAANRTPLVDASGEALNFEAALRRIVESDPDRDQLLRSKMKQGANSRTSQKTTPPAPTDTGSLTGKDKIAAALAAAIKK